jgi:hypothetical protein
MGIEYKCPLVYCAIQAKSSDHVLLSKQNKSEVKNSCPYMWSLEHAMAQLIGAERYKLEGRGFDSRWCR